MRLLIACLAAAIASPAYAQSNLSQVEILRRLTQHVDSLASNDQFSGVVLLAQSGKPVFERAYGYADRSSKKPNTLETAFNLGSINKLFTGIAARQLVSAGKIHLDSTVSHYLPDYPNRDVAGKVTVRQLLDMKAGLGGNIFGAPPSGKRSDIRKLADFLPLFADEPLAFEPGTRRAYCNACYVVLGLIVERVSGQSYYDYVRDHVYAPAGLTHTTHYRADALPAHVALGYTREGGAEVQPNTVTLPGIGSSAGGGYSTAHDLLALVNALRAGRVPDGPPAGVGVAGGAPGINAVLEGDMPGGYDLIVMANMDPPAAQQVARFVRQLLGAPE